MSKTFLLTDEFPPIVTGISRLMGEIARRYPQGELLVSTGQHRDSLEIDARYGGTTIDRLPIPTRSCAHFAGYVAGRTESAQAKRGLWVRARLTTRRDQNISPANPCSDRVGIGSRSIVVPP